MAVQPARRVVATDVAREVGVSQKTVSRVVNGDPHVRPEVRVRVLGTIERLGYQPNRAARALVSGRSRSIGLLSIGSTDYGPSSLMVGSERAIKRAGYALILVNTPEGDPEAITSAIRDLHTLGVDGLVINEPSGSFTPPTGLADLPVLSLSGRSGASMREIVVGTDEAGGVAEVMSHLLGLGHRTVHHVAGPAAWGSATRRRAAWEEELRRAGAPVPTPVHGDWSVRSGYEAGRRLAEDPELTAVFTANDQMAIGVLRALSQAGVRVPEDVSVVGFDDVPEAAYLSTALTTVRQDLAATADRGVGLLVGAIEHAEVAPTRELMPVRLVVRETTAPPRPV